MAKKKTAPRKEKSFEESHWETADKLRGSVESSEYKHVILSLIFLKFVSDKFEERRAGGKKEVSPLHHSSFPLFPPRARHSSSMPAKWDP